jgi:glyoxylase-like metal-dependent hydrolase (beta-lactamase superfamily II)
LKDNESNPAHLKSSLQRLEQLQLGIIFPGHGPSVAAGRQAIARMIEALD